MKTIFISQPMKGKSREQIMEEREHACSVLKEKGYTVYQSVQLKAPETAQQSVWYLGNSLKFLSECDCAYFMEGFENANGCSIEYDVCKRYGIPSYTNLEEIPKIN